MAAIGAAFLVSACATPEVPTVCWNQPTWTETRARIAANSGAEPLTVDDRAGFMARFNAVPPATAYPVPDLIAYAPLGETVVMWIVLRGCVVDAEVVPADFFRSLATPAAVPLPAEPPATPSPPPLRRASPRTLEVLLREGYGGQA